MTDKNQEKFLFTLTPGQIQLTDPINYNLKAGLAHWKSATALLRKDSELYDCTPDGFHQFIKCIRVRADSFGWSNADGILWVAPDPSKPDEKRYLLVDYGVFSMEVIRDHELSYVGGGTRKAQDNRMLFECVYHSLSTEGMAKINIHDDQYTMGKAQVPSALCLLKVLIRESYLDSNATTSMIRQKLANLDEHLSESGNDICKFNNQIKQLLNSLTARGKTTQDLQTNLFKAYASCSDKVFVKYIYIWPTDSLRGRGKHHRGDADGKGVP